MFIGKRIRMRPKIVFMEAQSLGDDMELSMFDNLGDVTIYDVDDADKNAEHIKDADIAVMNKIKMDESILKDAKNLKLICITATGTDPIDVPYIKKRGIAASNVVGYSTEAVVQHTFSLLFYVKRGEYERQVGFGCFPEKFHELAGKTWGIIGLGRIGRRVADIAKAFGCEVIYYSTSGKNSNSDYRQVSFDELLLRSDIVSIHAPLNDVTSKLMNESAFKKMKKDAVLLNLGRGGIIDDEALAEAIENDEIGAVGLDVLNGEPIKHDNPLNRILDRSNVYITPHIAWAAVESRKRCVEEVYKNIEAFLDGEVRNQVYEI